MSFLGQFDVAFAARRVVPKTSLGTLVLTTQLANMLWPIFLLLSQEQVRFAPGITRVTTLAFVSHPWLPSLLARIGSL
jgi:hypothetical protein